VGGRDRVPSGSRTAVLPESTGRNAGVGWSAESPFRGSMYGLAVSLRFSDRYPPGAQPLTYPHAWTNLPGRVDEGHRSVRGAQRLPHANTDYVGYHWLLICFSIVNGWIGGTYTEKPLRAGGMVPLDTRLHLLLKVPPLIFDMALVSSVRRHFRISARPGGLARRTLRPVSPDGGSRSRGRGHRLHPRRV